MSKVINDTVQRQQDYVKSLEQKAFDFGLVISEAFVKSMRDIGYKSTATALAEEIDNSVEAGARNIHVLYGFLGKSDAKPSQLAVVDDGHGMVPQMVRAAVIWGGTHRHGSRELFGRYGFGLPSSCISQGRRFEVYSKVDGGEWHMCYIDLDEIAAGAFPAVNGKPVAPEAKQVDPPAWVASTLKSTSGSDLPSTGTVVVIDRLDRISWSTATTLDRYLLPAFGTTYRNLLRDVTIWVNEKKVQKVDPLFLDPDARHYDENEVRAIGLEPTIIEVKDRDSGKPHGVIKMRYALMPPRFAQNKSHRNRILHDNNGIIFLRAGRQLDVVNRTPSDWAGFHGSYSRMVKIEVDFDPKLDEEFSVTTSKQQIVPSERIWEILAQNGVKRALTQLLKETEEQHKKAKQERENPEPGEKRASEEVMEEAGRFRTGERPTSPGKQQERERTFEEEVKRREEQLGIPPSEARAELEAEVKLHPYRIDFEDVPGGPMYRPEGKGPQVTIWINREHPFFTELYEGPDSGPYAKSALELLLLILGVCELDSDEPRLEYYRTERIEWSNRFATVLRLLEKKHPAAASASE
jgi:hypothetical protein